MTDYDLVIKQLEGFASAESWYISLFSNASALLDDAMEDINWVGFYIMVGDHLAVGPFQGKEACIKIAVGKGVCGTAVAEDRVIRVEDVHKFFGHIACDSASNSEIVLPIHKSGKVIGVLDIDSPVFSRFNDDDEAGLKAVVSFLEEKATFN